MSINISNQKNRDAVVATEALMPHRTVRYVNEKGRPVSTKKLLKSDVEHDLPALLKKSKKIDKVASALIKGDPEIDIESFGMFLSDLSRVYVTAKGIVDLIEEVEVIYNHDGTARDSRPTIKWQQTMYVEDLMNWTGKFNTTT